MVYTVFIFCKCLKPVFKTRGIVIKKEIGDKIKEGDILASLYTNIDNKEFNLERIFEIS